MKFHLPVRLFQSLMACISVAACLGAAAEESAPRDLTVIGAWPDDIMPWGGGTSSYPSFIDENGNQTRFKQGDNVTFSGSCKLGLFEDISAGKLTFETGSYTGIKPYGLDTSNYHTLSAEHVVLRGTLEKIQASKPFGLSFGEGTTLEMDGGGFVKMDINLGGGTLLYHNSISAVDSNLTLSGGTKLQFASPPNFQEGENTLSIDLFTNVGSTADGFNVFNADGTRWDTLARKASDYLNIEGRGLGFWNHANLQIVNAGDGTYTLQLSNSKVWNHCESNRTYSHTPPISGYSHINFSDNDISETPISTAYLTGALESNYLLICDNYQVHFKRNKANNAQENAGYGGAIYVTPHSGGIATYLEIKNNYSVLFEGNNAASYGGAICSRGDGLYGFGPYITCSNNHELKFIGNTVGKSGHVRGGAIYLSGHSVTDIGLEIRDNDIVHFERNGADVAASWIEGFGGAICGMGDTLIITGNTSVTFIDNKIKATLTDFESGSYYNTIRGGALYASSSHAYNAQHISDNGKVLFSGNTLDGLSCDAWGGAIYCENNLVLSGNKELIFRGNKVISNITASGGAIYANGDLGINGNDHVLFEKNVEVNNGEYKLRSIVVLDGSFSMECNEGQSIVFYDTIYVNEASSVNFSGDILFSGLNVEDHLKEMKGSEGTEQEILNSRTSEVYCMTKVNGGRLRIEDGAIYKGNGIHVQGEEGTTLLLKDGILQHEGYAITINSGNHLTLQGENFITADTLTMADGSNLNISLKDADISTAVLSTTGDISASSINFNLSDVDTLAEGTYQLITRTEGEALDISNWTLSGVTAGELYWKGGTLYYAGKAGKLNISSAEELAQLGNIAGNLIINCAGSELTLDKAISASGSMGGDLVINKGSVVISGEGAVAGDIVFNGNWEAERRLRVEKDLSDIHMELNHGTARVAYVEIAEGKTMELSELRGNGAMQKTGKGEMRINGKGHKLGGKLDVAEGQLIFGGDAADGHEAEVNELVVGSQDDTATAQVKVDKNAAVTGTKLHVDGQNAVVTNEGSMEFTEEVRVSGGHLDNRGSISKGTKLHVDGQNAVVTNEGSMSFTEEVKVSGGRLDNRGSISKVTLEGGTVSGSGTFAGLDMKGGTLMVGNSPGLQSYSDALELKAGEVVFSVAGNEAATADTSGWGSNVYSCIDMNGHALTLGENVTLTIALGRAALESFISSTSEKPLQLTLTLIQDIGDVSFLTNDILASLVDQTQFIVTTEVEGLTSETKNLAGVNIGEFVTEVAYTVSDDKNLVLSVGFATNGRPIPEPTTATLSLLALAGLAARRRRK